MEALYSEERYSGNISAAFRKDDTELCRQFNSFLQTIKSDGTYSAMLDRWISDNAVSSSMPEIEEYDKGEVLEVGTIVMFPCAFIMNGEWAGFEIELMKRFAAYLKRPMRVEVYDFSAYSCEIFRTGICAVDKGQREAGLALGFTKIGTFSTLSFPRRSSTKSAALLSLLRAASAICLSYGRR